MPRASAPSFRLLPVIALVALVPAACGRRDAPATNGDLTFEKLADTTGLSHGDPLVEDFDAYRMDSGALRVKGRSRLPDGTRIRVAIKRPGERGTVALVQVEVGRGTFDSPPIIGEHGALPAGRYAFEITAQFDSSFQTPEVLRATQNGTSLRGPGITRTRIGGAMLWLSREMTR